jgi:hypothetical protein
MYRQIGTPLMLANRIALLALYDLFLAKKQKPIISVAGRP